MPSLGNWFGRFKKHKSPDHTPPPRTTPSSNLSTTVGNGLTVGLALLEKAVTGIGVPGLEAAVNGVVGVIDLIKDVRDNANDLRDLDDLMSSLANAISMAPNLHPGVEGVPKLLLSRVDTFVSELHGMLMEVKEMLGAKNAVVRAANSRAHKNAVEGIKERINRLLSRFSAEGILSLELDMVGARQDIRSVGKALAVAQEYLVVAQNAQEYENLINAIPRVHARYNDTSTKPTRPCHPGTRTGLLQIINRWIEDDPDATPYFWLCGEVGVGKSTAAHTIAQEQEALGRLGASFFFSRHDESRRTPHLLFTSIAYQLARFDRGIYNTLAEALKPDPDIVKRSLTEQFKRLVLQILAQSGISPSQTVVVVIDGLDECSDPASILDVLTLGIDDVGVRFRVLVSSRPYAAILSKFKDPRLYHLTSETQFHDINLETLSNDVAAYLSWSLGAIALKWNLPSPWPPREQLAELILRAAGLFIVASTYAKYIDDPEEGNPPGQLARILSRQMRVGASPLAELDALYDQVLEDLASRLPKEVVIARDIIAFVILAPDGMNVSVLTGLFRVDPFYIRSVLRRLTAVILLPDDDNRIIAPFHASFGEYIRDPTRCAVPELSIETEAAYDRIIARCFNVIASSVEDGIIGIEFNSAWGSYWIPKHVRYIGEHLRRYLLHSTPALLEEVKMTFVGAAVWTLLNIVFLFTNTEGLLELVTMIGGFEPLLHIKGSSLGERSASLGTSMIANHVVEINRMSDNVTAESEASPSTAHQVSRQRQALHFVRKPQSPNTEPTVDEVLEIVRTVRWWMRYTHRNVISIKSIDIKSRNDVPREVLVFITLPTSVECCFSLHEYLLKSNGTDLTARMRIALGVSDGLRYLHGSSSPQPHGGLSLNRIMVSGEGQPILYPSRWNIDFQSSLHLLDEDDIVGFTFRWNSTTLPFERCHWHPIGETDLRQRSLEPRLQADVWDFGSIIYEMVTGDGPLTAYDRLAKGDIAMGYNEDKGNVPEEYWQENDYKSHYAMAVSLLLDTLDAFEDIKSLLKSCWAIVPQDRPPMSEVFERLEAIVEDMDT